MCLVLLLLLVLKRLQLQESQTEGNEGHTPNDGNRALLNSVPVELLRVEIKVQVSQTSTEVITESIGEEELEGIVDETVESDPVEHVVNIDGAAGSNTDSSETHPKTHTSETMATRGKGSPVKFVDGKMGTDESTLGVLFLNVSQGLLHHSRSATKSSHSDGSS